VETELLSPLCLLFSLLSLPRALSSSTYSSSQEVTRRLVSRYHRLEVRFVLLPLSPSPSDCSVSDSLTIAISRRAFHSPLHHSPQSYRLVTPRASPSFFRFFPSSPVSPTFPPVSSSASRPPHTFSLPPAPSHPSSVLAFRLSMFDRLPPELVQQIFEASVTSLYIPETYRERQKTLRSLCLVSHRFLSFARPLLYELVAVGPQANLDHLLDTIETEGWSNRLRQVVFIAEEEADRALRFDRLGRIAGRTLRSLIIQLWYDPQVDLSFLTAFSGQSYLLRSLPHSYILTRSLLLSGLVSLCLLHEPSDGGDFTLESHILLPNLKQLVVTYSTLVDVPALLDPDAVPALEELSIRDRYGARDLSKIDTVKFSNLVPQLSVLQLPWNLCRDAPSFIQERLERILLDCFRYDLQLLLSSRPAVSHLRILEWDYGRSTPLYQLAELSVWIEDHSQPTLRSLSLNASLRDPARRRPRLKDLIDKILQACEERKIEVIFEVHPHVKGFGAYFSDAFCRRQRALGAMVLEK